MQWEEELSVRLLPPLKEDFIFAHAFLMAYLGNNPVDVSQEGDFTKYMLRSFSGTDTFTIEKSAKRLSFERKNNELHYRSVYDISQPDFVKCTSSWESSPLGKRQRYEAEILANALDGVYDSRVSEKVENWMLDSFLSANLQPPGDKPQVIYRFRQPELEKMKIASRAVEQVPYVCMKGIPTVVDVLDDCFSGEQAEEIPAAEFTVMRQQSRKKYEDIQRMKKLLQTKKEKEQEKQRLELARLAAANLAETKMPKKKKEKDEQEKERK